MPKNMKPGVYGPGQRMEQWFLFRLCIRKMNLKKMAVIQCYYMRMVLMEPTRIHILTAL